MRVRRALNLGLTVLLAFSVHAASLAQTPPPPKKKIKDFGSSLKRLRWDPEKQTAVESASNNQPNNNEDGLDVIRIESSLVTSDILVVDAQGSYVSGLTAEDFVINEDGEPQQVGHFLLGDNPNLRRSIVLIIDYSGSQFPYIKTSVAAAKTLVDKLNPLDRMAIVTDDVELIADFTDDKKKLKKKLDSLAEKATGSSTNFFGFQRRRFGTSEQYSALMATLNEMFDDTDKRPIVVFQTDGDEAYRLQNPILRPTMPENLTQEQQAQYQAMIKQAEATRKPFSLDDVYRTAEKSRATIYTVIPGSRFIGLAPEQQIAQMNAENAALREALMSRLSPEAREKFKAREAEWFKRSNAVMLPIVEARAKLQSALSVVAPLTGGWTDFLTTPEQADEIYSRILADINKRYIVGYYPTNKEFDGKRRTISIEVRGHPDYKILGRKAYYAPGPNPR